MKHVARKRFGQNFLVDRGIIEAIVAAIRPQPGDAMVEIGPGLAALTGPLVAALGEGDGRLNVVEIDRDLAERLGKRFDGSRLALHVADALEFDFGQLARGAGSLRIVGNLPYNISSPLLFHLMDCASQVRDQHFMLQREVVERMVAGAGDSAYGRLSVMLSVRYQMDHLFDVPPESFDPPPRVTSAFVRMIPKPVGEVNIADPLLFSQVVLQAFSQRRKMLRNTLSMYAQELPYETFGIAPTARAEDIAPDVYVSYANALADQRRSRSSHSTEAVPTC